MVHSTCCHIVSCTLVGAPVDHPLPLTRIARQLFDTVEDISDFVERSVDMTVISRSYANMTVSQVFGVEMSNAKMVGLDLAIRQESEMAAAPSLQSVHDSCGRVAKYSMFISK